MIRPTPRTSLDAYARAALFRGTSVSMECALSIPDDEITFDFMLRSGVRVLNCVVAGVGPCFLSARGARCAADLRAMGFDCISLCDSALCSEAVLAFGSSNVAAAFVTDGKDAVCLAGTRSMQILGLMPQDLLCKCRERPVEASEVARATRGR